MDDRWAIITFVTVSAHLFFVSWLDGIYLYYQCVQVRLSWTDDLVPFLSFPTQTRLCSSLRWMTFNQHSSPIKSITVPQVMFSQFTHIILRLGKTMQIVPTSIGWGQGRIIQLQDKGETPMQDPVPSHSIAFQMGYGKKNPMVLQFLLSSFFFFLV